VRALATKGTDYMVDKQLTGVFERVSELARQYEITSIEPMLESCRAVARQDEISIAVLGRFKAGKSSFLNDLLRRNLLPVGVVPVTTVVTEIMYGLAERALVRFVDGHDEEIPVEAIRCFISENENPENQKQVSRVAVKLPTLERFAGLRFVDTPGLQGVLAHNTAASIEWLPNVGLALVAVSVDTPLSQHDVDLLTELHQYTPNVSILLTKADLLSEVERDEVGSFIGKQLTRAFDSAVPVFAYSIRPGYERFRASLEDTLIAGTLAEFQQQRSAILGRKLQTALGECEEYLTLALTSAQMIGSERNAIKSQVVGDKDLVDDVKSQIHLVIRRAMAETRPRIAKVLEAHREELQTRLSEALEREFPNWTRSLDRALKSFETWLGHSLSDELAEISANYRSELLTPLDRVKQQVLRALQGSRDQLSERALRAFGVPLRTTEVEIRLQEPSNPDIRIGNVFDRNWELLSPIAPMSLMKGIVRQHFGRRVPNIVEVNLSRLTTQWEQSINSALSQVDKEAQGRLDELVHTVERLLENSSDRAPHIQSDLRRIFALRDEAGGIPASLEME
jgi:GTP-binding protein EngB required for normal cell division